MATVRAGSDLRALPWARPRNRRYVEPIEAAIVRLEAAVDGAGAMFDALCDAPLPHKDGPQERSRRMRSDGRRNLVSLAQALVASADLATGYLASPSGEPGRRLWDRHAWGRLDHRAYGDLVAFERSHRRTERHARTLAALGFVSVVELKVSAGQGAWRSVVAIKRLTPKFYATLGLAVAVKRARQERDRAKGVALVAQLSQVPRRRRKPASTVAGSVACGEVMSTVPPIRPPPEAPVVPSVSVADAIARARAVLGIG